MITSGLDTVHYHIKSAIWHVVRKKEGIYLVLCPLFRTFAVVESEEPARVPHFTLIKQDEK